MPQGTVFCPEKGSRMLFSTIWTKNEGKFHCLPKGAMAFSCIIESFTGRLPAFKRFTKSSVSSTVKLPDIEDVPPLISPCIVGNEYTLSPITMAIDFPILSFVKRSHVKEASEVILIET